MTMNESIAMGPEVKPRGRSVFVTAVGWVLIALAAQLALLFGAGLVLTLIGLSESHAAGTAASTSSLVAYRAWWDVFRLVGSVATVLLAIGLLRRRGWARWGLVTILACASLWWLTAPLLDPRSRRLFWVSLFIWARMVPTAVDLALGVALGGVALALCRPSVGEEFRGHRPQSRPIS
jgi:hypothetical protein